MKSTFEELGNQKVATRDRAQSKLDLLESWLSTDRVWTISEAAHILAGVDPETPIHAAVMPSGEILLRLFPGIRPPTNPQGWSDLAQTLSEDIGLRKEIISRFKGSMKISPLIAQAKKAGIEPPWLEAALAHKGCSSYLPLKILKAMPNFRKAQRVKAINKNAETHGRFHQAIYDHLNGAILNFPACCFTQGNPKRNRPRRLANAKVARWLEAELPANPDGKPYDITTITSRIRQWRIENPSVEK